MHELGPEPNFNESMYFNVYDPALAAGGFFRLGNRPNESSGEMTVCLWLPDGRVGFMFRRPEVRTNQAFDAAGMSFDVIEPFVRLEIRYAGEVVLLEDPMQLADPRAAFSANPRALCEVHLAFEGISSMYGGEPDEPHERAGEEFARGHYEQLTRVSGSIDVAGLSLELHGWGLRDHSWGPRHWQAPWYYRWLTANFGEDFGFMGSRIARRDSEGIRAGFVWDRGTMHLCDGFRIRTVWGADGLHHRALEAELVAQNQSWKVQGKVLTLVPLRNRRRDESGSDLLTRISEGLTRWSLDDGRIGYGLSEYLDQIISGAPVGLRE